MNLRASDFRGTMRPSDRPPVLPSDKTIKKIGKTSRDMAGIVLGMKRKNKITFGKKAK